MNANRHSSSLRRLPLLAGMLLLAAASVAPAGVSSDAVQAGRERQAQRREDRREQRAPAPRETRAPRAENRVTPPPRMARGDAGGPRGERQRNEPPRVERPRNDLLRDGLLRNIRPRDDRPRDEGVRYEGPRFARDNDRGRPARPPAPDYRPPASGHRPPAPGHRPPAYRPPRPVHSLPSGYHRYHWQGRPYYYAQGHWYRPWGSQYAIVAAPFGMFVSYLPGAYNTFWYGNTRYFFADDTYYLYEPTRRGYVVTRSPYGDDREDDEDYDDDEPFIYPANGQSEQQQADDRYECHRWAVGETGYDPVEGNYDPDERADYTRALGACMTGRGYTVR